MQQTEKYKLNLIESSDPFLPDALNANTQRVEDVLIDRMEGSLDAMDQRVTVLEAKRFVTGTYQGNGADWQTITLGFKPKVVIVATWTYGLAYMTIAGFEGSNLQIVNNGFKVRGGNLTDYLNYPSQYCYAAFE